LPSPLCRKINAAALNMSTDASVLSSRQRRRCGLNAPGFCSVRAYATIRVIATKTITIVVNT